MREKGREERREGGRKEWRGREEVGNKRKKTKKDFKSTN
jgi:hypothetical protein